VTGDVPRVRQRLHLLLPALALAAILAALAGAIGPAKDVQMRYSWPPRALPGAQPQKLWYTPLLLTRHEPQSLSITLPCARSPALPDAGRPTLVLGTTREAPGANGLAVVRRDERLLVRLGSETLATVALPARQTSDCAYRLELGAGRWSIAGGPSAPKGGSLDHMPMIVGLFSGLDLRAGAAPTVNVTTVVQGTRTRTHQAVFWTLSALASLAALALASLWGSRRRASRETALRRALAHVGLPDVAVALLLLAWWVVGPAFFDDGWVAARQLNYSTSRGFSAYYTSFGVNLPLDYWLEWVEHWLVQSSTSLLILRIPALVCLLGTWILCRWLFVRTVGTAAYGAARWALACGFAVAALAWGMTLRPEPVLALMVMGVLACVVAFIERPRVAPLALAAVLVVLSLSAHPAGIVAFAPVLAAAPTIGRWVRDNVRVSGSIVVAATALLVVLVTVGSDLQRRRADITSLRTYGDETAGWRDELVRYSLLSQPPYETPLRRASVALIALAVFGFLLRRRSKGEDRLLGLPATALGLALVLLIATPTKWPWHFGALIGLAAVAIAAETARLRGEAEEPRRWDVRPFLVILAATAAAAWSWNPRASWGDLDLRTLHWTLSFENRLTLSKLGGSLPVLLLILLALVEVARRREGGLYRVPSRAVAWMVPVIAIPLISFTVAVLIGDTVKTSTWTLARQNLDSLRGRLHCGVGDSEVVAARGSMRPVPTIGSRALPLPDSWLPPAPARGVQGFALAPPSRGRPSRSPWFEMPASRQLGFFLAGSPSQSESLELEWGRRNGGNVVPIGADNVAGDAADDARPDLAYWRFQAAGDLPDPPARATSVRFALSTKGIPGGPVGLTSPVTYENESLATLLERESPSLPLPNLLMYVPCVDLPRVGVVAQTPGSILAFRDSMWPVTTDTSPFAGVPDLYPLVRLPLSDSPDPPGEVAVYEVDQHLEGGVLVPPEQSPSA
jgi:hypothetical protein